MKLAPITSPARRRHEAYSEVTMRIRNDPVSGCKGSVSCWDKHVGHTDKVAT